MSVTDRRQTTDDRQTDRHTGERQHIANVNVAKNVAKVVGASSSEGFLIV